MILNRAYDTNRPLHRLRFGVKIALLDPTTPTIVRKLG